MELAKRPLLIGLVQKEQKRNVADLKLEVLATRETQKEVSLLQALLRIFTWNSYF